MDGGRKDPPLPNDDGGSSSRNSRNGNPNHPVRHAPRPRVRFGGDGGTNVNEYDDAFFGDTPEEEAASLGLVESVRADATSATATVAAAAAAAATAQPSATAAAASSSPSSAAAAVTEEGEVWQLRFEELCQYRAEHGDCLVPVRNSERKALALWVSNQRRYFRLFRRGSPAHGMNQERAELLEGIGFVWDVGAAAEAAGATRFASALAAARPAAPVAISFDVMFSELQAYQSAHGNTNVPLAYVTPPSGTGAAAAGGGTAPPPPAAAAAAGRRSGGLGRWVSMIRDAYRRSQGGQPSVLSSVQIGRLNELGFAWDAPNSARESARVVGGTRTLPAVNVRELFSRFTPPAEYPTIEEALAALALRAQSDEGPANLRPTAVLRDDTPLNKWCTIIRIEYRMRFGTTSTRRNYGLTRGTERPAVIGPDDEQGGVLTNDRIQVLEGIGFEWTYDLWMERYQEFRLWTNERGQPPAERAAAAAERTSGEPPDILGAPNPNPSSRSFRVCPALARWVAVQRREYESWQRGGSSRLTDERIQLLFDLDFDTASENFPVPPWGRGYPWDRRPDRSGEEGGNASSGGSSKATRRPPRLTRLARAVANKQKFDEIRSLAEETPRFLTDQSRVKPMEPYEGLPAHHAVSNGAPLRIVQYLFEATAAQLKAKDEEIEAKLAASVASASTASAAATSTSTSTSTTEQREQGSCPRTTPRKFPGQSKSARSMAKYAAASGKFGTPNKLRLAMMRKKMMMRDYYDEFPEFDEYSDSDDSSNFDNLDNFFPFEDAAEPKNVTGGDASMDVVESGGEEDKKPAAVPSGEEASSAKAQAAKSDVQMEVPTEDDKEEDTKPSAADIGGGWVGVLAEAQATARTDNDDDEVVKPAAAEPVAMDVDEASPSQKVAKKARLIEDEVLDMHTDTSDEKEADKEGESVNIVLKGGQEDAAAKIPIKREPREVHSIRDNLGYTCLHRAISQKASLEVVLYLIEVSLLNVDKKKDTFTSKEQAAAVGESKNICAFKVSNGRYVLHDWVDTYLVASSPATSEDNDDTKEQIQAVITRALIDAYPEALSLCCDGATPLITLLRWKAPTSKSVVSMERRIEEVANVMLSANQAAISIRCASGCNVFHYALLSRRAMSTLRLLLSFAPKGELLVRNNLGEYPLHIAAMMGLDDEFALVLNAEPTVAQKTDGSGRTPLHWAWLMYLQNHDPRRRFLEEQLSNNLQHHSAFRRVPSIKNVECWQKKTLELAKGMRNMERDDDHESVDLDPFHLEAPSLEMLEEFTLFWEKVKLLLHIVYCGEICDREPTINLRRSDWVKAQINDTELLTVHAAASVSCPRTILHIALILHPNQKSFPDPKTGMLPLHIAASGDFLREWRVDRKEPSAVQVLIDAFPGACSIRTKEGRLPVHHAIDRFLQYDLASQKRGLAVINTIIDEHPESQELPDGKNGLSPFMLAAEGPSGNVNLCFNLLLENPSLVKSGIS